MIEYHISNYFNIALMRLFYKVIKIGQATKTGINIKIISNIVTIIDLAWSLSFCVGTKLINCGWYRDVSTVPL